MIARPWSVLLLRRHLLDRIPNKCAILAQAGTFLGLIRLLERIAAQRPVLVVLTYHRIAIPGMHSNPFYDPVISATPEAFEAQMRFLSTRFHILGLETLLDIAADKGMNGGISATGKKPLALITFDDGYRDNCETALPILRKLGVLATFFIATGFLSALLLPWWDHVACAQANVCPTVPVAAMSRRWRSCRHQPGDKLQRSAAQHGNHNSHPLVP